MNIVINTYTSTNSKNDGKLYGNWSTKHYNEIKSFSITKSEEYFDLIINNNIDTTKPLYLLYAEYSHGDSFGNESGCLEYIKLFESLDEANLLKDDLELFEKYAKSEFKRYDFKPNLIDKFDKYDSWNRSFEYFGEKFCLPWGGYFEYLEKYSIIKLELSEFKKD